MAETTSTTSSSSIEPTFINDSLPTQENTFIFNHYQFNCSPCTITIKLRHRYSGFPDGGKWIFECRIAGLYFISYIRPDGTNRGIMTLMSQPEDPIHLIDFVYSSLHLARDVHPTFALITAERPLRYQIVFYQAQPAYDITLSTHASARH